MNYDILTQHRRGHKCCYGCYIDVHAYDMRVEKTMGCWRNNTQGGKQRRCPRYGKKNVGMHLCPTNTQKGQPKLRGKNKKTTRVQYEQIYSSTFRPWSAQKSVLLTLGRWHRRAISVPSTSKTSSPTHCPSCSVEGNDTEEWANRYVSAKKKWAKKHRCETRSINFLERVL